MTGHDSPDSTSHAWQPKEDAYLDVLFRACLYVTELKLYRCGYIDESTGLEIGSVGLCILCFICDTEVCFSCASFISKRDMPYTIRPLCSLTQ